MEKERKLFKYLKLEKWQENGAALYVSRERGDEDAVALEKSEERKKRVQFLMLEKLKGSARTMNVCRGCERLENRRASSWLCVCISRSKKRIRFLFSFAPLLSMVVQA